MLLVYFHACILINVATTKCVGHQTLTSDALYEGKVFKNRADFKQQMALYAINNKFRYTNARSTPEGMVLRCISTTCKWRIYAVKMKNVDRYEIRKVFLEHSCSVDDRAGTQHLLIKFRRHCNNRIYITK